jgi:ABC-type phosphate/phosphonate transport system substrate-binding protein
MFAKLLNTMSQAGIGLAILLVSMPLKAELVFSVPPWDSEEKQRAMFDPIAQAMSEWIGTKVVYQHNSNFTTYSLAMRGGKFDLVFDGPQFNAWRMKNSKHDILVNLPERLTFMVITGAGNNAVTSTEDLIDKQVCGQSPPHLGTLLLWSRFPNSARQPILQTIKGETKVYDELKSGKCSVAIIRNNIYLQMKDAEKAKYKVIFTSRTVPNLAVSAGPDVTEKQRRVLIEKLTNSKNLGVFKTFFDMKAKAADKFEKADPQEYAGLDMLLKDGSYGW